MPQIDKYTAGSVAVTNGSSTVTGTATAWVTNGIDYSVLAGHDIVIGNFIAKITAVNSNGTQLTIVPAYTGATAAGLAYAIYRTSYLQTPAVMGAVQSVLAKGGSTAPLAALYVDSGGMRAALRDDGSGNIGIYAGGTGVADGSMVQAAKYDRAAGRWSFNGALGVSGGDVTLTRDTGALSWLSSAGRGWRAYNQSTGSTFGGLSFQYTSDAFATTLTEALILQSTGNVRVINNLGVNQASPAARVHATAGSSTGVRVDVTASSGPPIQFYKSDGATNQKYWDFAINANGTVGTLRLVSDDYTAATPVFDVSRTGITNGGVYYAGGLYPNADNSLPLGNASLRWGVIFSATGAINTSDAALKTGLAPGAAPLPIADDVLDAWGDVHVVAYRFIDAVAAKGEAAARIHHGWIAQEVEAAFAARGLDAARYGLFCRDEITAREEIATTLQVDETDPETGAVVTRAYPDKEIVETPAGERLGLRYDECLVLEAAWARREIARQSARIAALEAAASV
ncbi:tail fiber domain-containing protein [Azorhizobium doebereinerae]|uniref:tail fiber domain-containing protein n=1 Tax=Azorhizobium doebereinerae TaxID=281091 RepID=UPI00041396DC|nr:tail fiber domain-containing protein [Azorhizobium doebereinerae]